MLFDVYEVYQEFVIDMYDKHVFVVEYVFIFVNKHDDDK